MVTLVVTTLMAVYNMNRCVLLVRRVVYASHTGAKLSARGPISLFGCLFFIPWLRHTYLDEPRHDTPTASDQQRNKKGPHHTFGRTDMCIPEFRRAAGWEMDGVDRVAVCVCREFHFYVRLVWSADVCAKHQGRPVGHTATQKRDKSSASVARTAPYKRD